MMMFERIKLPDGSTANDLVNHLSLHPDEFGDYDEEK